MNYLTEFDLFINIVSIAYVLHKDPFFLKVNVRRS